MSYTALYRKFRPTSFADVKGQAHIVTTLKHQIESGRIGHAYVFAGSRGTGKTTAAKIFAGAVNCEAPIEGSPCGQCDMCKGIASGALLNVIEIDAASNNGVDNIRAIVEEVEYRPTKGTYKVYIIDEVHMLSGGAFNALLKTLEEPPAYVIFILATTEIHKIPVTILSRCQRYDFRRITVDVIVSRLYELMNTEGIEAEDRSVRYIAKAADGAMRDAISILDQCVSFYPGEPLTYAHVLEVLGTVDSDVFSALFRSVCAGDVRGVLEQIEEQVMEGRDLSVMVTDFTWHLRNLLLLKSGDSASDLLDVSEEALEGMQAEATLAEADTLVRFIRIFSELSGQLRYATQKRIIVEVAFIKLCRPQMETKQDSILERIRSLEKEVREVREAGNAVVYMSKDEVPVVKEKPKLKKALTKEVAAVAKDFRLICSEIEGFERAFLEKAKISVSDDDRLLIVLSEKVVGARLFNTPENVILMEEAIERRIGKAVLVEIQILPEDQEFDEVYYNIEDSIHMDITVK